MTVYQTLVNEQHQACMAVVGLIANSTASPECKKIYDELATEMALRAELLSKVIDNLPTYFAEIELT